MPRNSDMVPMVTTMAGRPMPVTSAPLKAPAAMPTSSPIGTSSATPAPAWAAMPMNTEASAMIEATDRSMSRTMISSAIDSASIAFSLKLKVASNRL